MTLEEFRAFMGDLAAGRTDADLSAPVDDRAGISAWQRRLLSQPRQVWAELEGDQRATLVDLAFPGGLVFDGVDFSNPSNSLMLLPLAGDPAAASCVVRATVQESNPEEQEHLAKLLAWKGGWAELESRIAA